MLGVLPCTAWKWVNIVKKIPTTLRPRLAFFLFTIFFLDLLPQNFISCSPYSTSSNLFDFLDNNTSTTTTAFFLLANTDVLYDIVLY